MKNATRNSRGNQGEEIEFIASDDLDLPEGDYVGVCVKIERRTVFRRESLSLTLEIIEGSHKGRVVPLFFNIPKSRKLPINSKLYRAWTVANRWNKPMREDRMSMRIFLEKMFRFSVRRVTKDNTGRKLHPSQQYSIGGDIHELL